MSRLHGPQCLEFLILQTPKVTRWFPSNVLDTCTCQLVPPCQSELRPEHQFSFLLCVLFEKGSPSLVSWSDGWSSLPITGGGRSQRPPTSVPTSSISALLASAALESVPGKLDSYLCPPSGLSQDNFIFIKKKILTKVIYSIETFKNSASYDH